MRRWPVVLLLVLALIILISPGLIGRLAEESLDESIAWNSATNPGVNVTTERFERGWFTAEGRHRVDLDGGRFREASEIYMAATGDSVLPSLLIDTRLDHGLLPLTSLGREEGSLAPGLASTVSSFALDLGSGETVAIPGALYTRVGLAGASNAHLLLKPGLFDRGTANVRWQGTDMNFRTDPGSGVAAIDGTVSAIRLNADELDAGFESLSVSATQSATEYGVNIGNADIELVDFAFGIGGQRFAVADLSIKTLSTLADERVSGSTSFVVAELATPTGDRVDVDMDISFAGLDAQSLGVISTVLKQSRGASDPQAAMANILPQIEMDLQMLVQRGLELNVKKFDVSLPQGLVSTVIDVDVATLDDDAPFSWPGVLLNMTASVDVRMPAALFDMLAAVNPEAGSLVAMGILLKDGSDYVMEADYAQGLVNVNGAPMPVPIPGL